MLFKEIRQLLKAYAVHIKGLFPDVGIFLDPLFFHPVFVMEQAVRYLMDSRLHRLALTHPFIDYDLFSRIIVITLGPPSIASNRIGTGDTSRIPSMNAS